jgi:signal-transduction protein with cAMP-binding, CBS, and nucleotidyltransferase domain
MLIKDIMSSPLTTIDAVSPVEVAADLMIQNRVRHLLVVENDDIDKPLGIITPTDFVGYLKENLNIDHVNAKILRYLQEERQERQERQEEQEKSDKVIEELEERRKLPMNPQKGGEEYENEQPRHGF